MYIGLLPTKKKKKKKTDGTDCMFLDKFSEFLDSCNTLSGQLCILGDFNVHYDRPNDHLTANILDILNMYNLQQTVV